MMRLLRSSIPRLTRATVLTTAVCALALPLSGVPALPTARAAGSIVYQQYAAAMAKVFAYRATVDEQVGAGSGQAKSVFHLVMDVVRKGKVNQMYARVTVSSGAMQTLTLEEVSTGTHSCVKFPQVPMWNCQTQNAPGVSLADLTPTNYLNQAGGSGVGLKPVGTKTVAGVRSTGYSVYGAVVASMGITGTIWLDTANHRITEFDWTEKSKNTQVLLLKMVFSNYNDKSLHIPSVPAS
jgi:hypothetical protein